MPAATDEPLLDPAHAAFIQQCVSINVAARDVDHVPNISRAIGCRVSDDRRHVTVFLARAQAIEVLANLASNPIIAVVFTRPSTHQAIQLKASDAAEVPCTPSDEEVYARSAETFIQELVKVGYREAFARAVIPPRGREVVAVRFTPTDAFVQTPGPNAGQRLRP